MTCAVNRSLRVRNLHQPPHFGVSPASEHPTDVCYSFRLNVFWQPMSLSFIVCVCSLLPLGELTVTIYREQQQSLVAMLPLLSTRPLKLSANLTVLKTSSNGA